MKAIFTIGYEKADPKDFLATLAQAEINLLIDVRERAMSRRKGFAKTALRENLQSIGVDYIHEPTLGSPSEVRNELRASKNFDRFFRKYDAYLDTQTDILDRLTGYSGNVVLLCYERAPCECHRTSVARELSNRTGLEVRHLGVKCGLHDHRRKNTRTSPRQGLSPA